jgi:hypothetical protein
MENTEPCQTCRDGGLGNCGKCHDGFEFFNETPYETKEQILDRINGKVTHYHNGERYIKWSDAKQAMQEYRQQIFSF